MDGQEVKGWTVIIYRQISYEEIERRHVVSNPNNDDSDDDGLKDGIEMGYSDPDDTDTDGDGMDDKTEYDAGSPLNAIDGSAPRLLGLDVDKNIVYKKVVTVDAFGYSVSVSYPEKYRFSVSFTAVDGGGLSSIDVSMVGGTSTDRSLDGETTYAYSGCVYKPYLDWDLVQGWEIDINVVDVYYNVNHTDYHVNTQVQDWVDRAEELGVASIKKAYTTLPLDLLDLARHNDPEVAGRARRLIDSMDVGNAVEEALSMWHHPPEKILAKITVLPPKWRKRVMTNAADTLKEVGFSKQERHLRSELKKVEDIPQQKLIPTGTPAGDRYYVKLTWNKDHAKTADCLARLLFKEMNLWPLDHEKKFAESRTRRVVYWYSRTKALNVALGAGKCGAKAEYISGLPASK